MSLVRIQSSRPSFSPKASAEKQGLSLLREAVDAQTHGVPQSEGVRGGDRRRACEGAVGKGLRPARQRSVPSDEPNVLAVQPAVFFGCGACRDAARAALRKWAVAAGSSRSAPPDEPNVLAAQPAELFWDAVRVEVRRAGRAVVRRAVMARDGFSARRTVAARGGFSAAAAFAAARCGRRPLARDERRKKAFVRNDGQRLRKRWEHADLNRRPPACRAGALNQLSYAPCIKNPSSRGMVGKTCGS